ncbi:hypothetical protein [Bosea sp. 685]|uniref:hypothetical protein n=1 Tax=Bosea sp. 685 TaxID=3080057 RepID=UPI0028935EB3|nr:hypothetical protein [Bosea sp. 685]WNJ89042.1 hypothetical protein RMR04_21870 [Bosea sp. 685]
MLRNRSGLVAVTLFLLSSPAGADDLDVLQGKFAFNWHANPGRQKCVKVAGPLLTSFKSTGYRCDLTAQSNTSSGASARTCTEVKGQNPKEYLVFDTLRACERERKTQESNGEG